MSKPPLPPSQLTRAVTRDVQGLLAGDPDVAKLNQALRHLCKWRARLIENTIAARNGRQVQTGPFRGLHYDVTATEGAGAARLLGCYEKSLSPVFEEIIARGYGQIIDIGCAEGYYAVGLARRSPEARIMARDTNPAARKACVKLAELNGVGDRVEVGGAVTPEDFEICFKQKTLVLCDIEGAEAELLTPQAAPGLSRADILVEVHDCFIPGLSRDLVKRFQSTHDIQTLSRSVDMAALPDWMEEWSDLDRLLTLWEWRSGSTPWLWMTSHEHP